VAGLPPPVPGCGACAQADARADLADAQPDPYPDATHETAAIPGRAAASRSRAAAPRAIAARAEAEHEDGHWPAAVEVGPTLAIAEHEPFPAQTGTLRER